MNNYLLIVFDSCRYDTFLKAKPGTISRLGKLEARWSYASWTAPSHYNLLTGLMPHKSPRGVFASEYYQRDFLHFNNRLGTDNLKFSSFVPTLNLPAVLQSIGYSTHALMSLPVLNPYTALNTGFDTYKLMDRHNDMRAMLKELRFNRDRPSFYVLNVGETHYPYALPEEPPDEWPRISGVHGVFKHLDACLVGGKVSRESSLRRFDQKRLRELKARQQHAVSYLDGVAEELFDLVPKNTFITITSDHGELFGEDGYFGHGPIQHPKVFEVPFLEGKLR